MRSSVGRYLLWQVVPFAALVNVGINAIAGRALYPPGHAVPLFGATSIAGDTLVGGFLIGLFTFLGAVPSGRREARSGRVRGGGRSAAWLGWTGRHPFLGALVFAAVTTALDGLVVAALDMLGIRALEREAFVSFKVAFAGVLGVVAAVVATLLGIAKEPDVSLDPRWCRDPSRPTGGAVCPLDYIDKGALAVTDRERGTSGTPTWQLVVRGALDPAHVGTALGHVVTRYPSLATKVQSLDAVPLLATKFRYAHDPSFHMDEIFGLVDCRGDREALAALGKELRNRHLDLFTSAPLTLTMAITSDESCHLFFRQHHAIADGRAFIALLLDFAAFLEAARAGRSVAADALVPVGRRGELEALGLSGLRRMACTLAGYGRLAAAVARGVRRPLVPSLQNRSNDYTGENGTVHWIVGDAALDAWNVARKRIGVSLNSLLTGALLVANARWHVASGLPVGRTTVALLMETRPRDGSFVSFANHLAALEVETNLTGSEEPRAIAREIQAQVTAQRGANVPVKRLLAERHILSLMTLEQIKKLVFEAKRPTHNLNFSNLIALDFPALGGKGWAVEEVLITTPVVPRNGIVLTVIRYGGRLFFNFNYKASAATREQTEELSRRFREVLEEIASASPS